MIRTFDSTNGDARWEIAFLIKFANIFKFHVLDLARLKHKQLRHFIIHLQAFGPEPPEPPEEITTTNACQAPVAHTAKISDTIYYSIAKKTHQSSVYTYFGLNGFLSSAALPHSEIISAFSCKISLCFKSAQATIPYRNSQSSITITSLQFKSNWVKFGS